MREKLAYPRVILDQQDAEASPWGGTFRSDMSLATSILDAATATEP
jgi:hypothetical protein